MEENLVYKIRKGTLNFGKDYEISLAALYGIFLLHPHIEDAWIATNADSCGDFDDVVIHWNDTKINSEELVMIQCKHSNCKKKIGYSRFVNSKLGKDTDFFLEKYINSWASIVSLSSANSVVCETTQRLKDSIKCVLFTNCEVDSDADKIVDEVGLNGKSLSFINVNGYIHKFVPEMLCKTIVHTILNKLHDVISNITLNETLAARNLPKHAPDIKLKEVLIAKEQLGDLILKVIKRHKDFTSANSKENIVGLLTERLNKIIATTNISAIIAEEKLNDPIVKEKLNKFCSSGNLIKVFLDTKIATCISKEQISEMVSQMADLHFEFLNRKLFLLSGQESNEGVRKVLAEELAKILPVKTDSNCDLDEVVTKYLLFVSDWAQGKLGDHYLLTKSHISAKLTELLVKPYISRFYTTTSSNCFPIEKLNKWASAVKDQNVTIISLGNSEDFSSTIMEFLCQYVHGKIRESLSGSTGENWEEPFTSVAQEKFYNTNNALLKGEMLRTIGNTGRITLSSLYKTLWKLQHLPIILETVTAEQYEKVVSILNLFNYRFKVIIIDKSQPEPFHAEKNSAFFTNLDHLNHEVRNLILDETVQLQGRPIQLRQLIQKHEPLQKLVTCRDIIHILTGSDTFTIGNRFNALPEFFIPRKMSKVLLDIPKLVETLNHSKAVHVVECPGKHFLFDCLRALGLNLDSLFVIDYAAIKNDPTVTGYKIITISGLGNDEGAIEKLFSGTNIHYLILDDNRNLEWVKTVGSVDTIKACSLQAHLDLDTSVGAVDVLTHFSRQLNIISASPGMGKTTIMDYIAYKTPLNMWVLRINLNQHLAYYGSETFQQAHSTPSAHLEYFNEAILEKHTQNTALDKTTFTYFLRSNSVLTLLDGFDEISPCYKRQVTDMIKSLLLTHHKVWITTRPALKMYVEQVFNTIAVTLSPLSVEDQTDFLTKYFMEALKKKEDPEEVRKFATQLLELTKSKLNDGKQEFTSVPLQTMLLADSFTDACKRAIDNQDFALNKNINLLSLYETFTQRKIQILADTYGSYAKQLLESFEKYQQFYALRVVFSEEDLQGLKINEQLDTYSKGIHNIEELVQKDGIIVTLDGSHLTFAHRTFAEYFIAKWLAQNFTNPIVKKLIKKLFDDGYLVIRSMFDQILAKACPLHTLIINGQFDKAEELIKSSPTILNDRDEGGRLAAHLAASWGVRHPMPGKNELADSNIHKVENHSNSTSLILQSMGQRVDMFTKDEIMGLTPLDYAIATDCLLNLDAIISTFERTTNANFRRKVLKTYLYYSIRYGYNALAKAIMCQVLHTDIQLRDSRNARRRKLGHYLAVSARCCYGFLPKSSVLKFVHINSHIDVNSCSPIHLAATYGHTEILTFILSCGANVNARDAFLHTALHYAVRSGSYTNISLLISNGADVHAGDDYKRTPLHHACKNCSVEVIELLLSSGADVHAKDKDSRTALHHAAKNGSMLLVPLLLSKGADLEARDVDKRTPLMHAAKNNFLNMVALLISEEADVNAGDYRNVTALLHATIRGYSDIIALLVEHGANTDTNDTFGQSAVDYSSMYDKFPASNKMQK